MDSFDRCLKINMNVAAPWFGRALTQLAIGNFTDFEKDSKRGFASRQNESEVGDVVKICQHLLRGIDVHDRTKLVARLYAENDALGLISWCLVETIPQVLDRGITQSAAESWLSAWETASNEGPELNVPLRLLAAAVEWKKNKSPRALLALPIEERRILESLLPREAEHNAIRES
jgi:hypothetical protein